MCFSKGRVSAVCHVRLNIGWKMKNKESLTSRWWLILQYDSLEVKDWGFQWNEADSWQPQVFLSGVKCKNHFLHSSLQHRTSLKALLMFLKLDVTNVIVRLLTKTNIGYFTLPSLGVLYIDESNRYVKNVWISFGWVSLHNRDYKEYRIRHEVYIEHRHALYCFTRTVPKQFYNSTILNQLFSLQ